MGVLYSFSAMSRTEPALVLAFVTLDEGPTMMTNLVDCEVTELRIGQKVRVVYRESESGQPVPMFTPV